MVRITSHTGKPKDEGFEVGVYHTQWSKNPFVSKYAETFADAQEIKKELIKYYSNLGYDIVLGYGN